MKRICSATLTLVSLAATLTTAAQEYGTPACPANARGIFQTGVFPARGLVRNFDEQTNIGWKTPRSKPGSERSLAPFPLHERKKRRFCRRSRKGTVMQEDSRH